MGLPDIILALNPGTGPSLVAHRRPDGTAVAGTETWPVPVPPRTLFLFWPPRRFPWSGPASRCAALVEEGSGVVLPLTTVLRRMEMPAPRSLTGLLEVLGVGMEDFEDPGALGNRLAEALGAALDGFEGSVRPEPGTAPEPRYRPCPEVLCLLPVVPEKPGVYVFHAAEGGALYVGKAASLRARVLQHFSSNPVEEEKTRRLAREAQGLTWETTGSELEALILEQEEIAHRKPVLNTLERVHRRRRGMVREERLLLCLPSENEGYVEVCLVAGDGRFHWERVPRRERVPRGLWQRVSGFLAGGTQGWSPRRPRVELSPEAMAERAEIVLSWLVRHPDRASRIDLKYEHPTRDLARRLRRLLAEDPRGERVKIL